MSDSVIEVDGLGKCYRIGVRLDRAATRVGRLRQALGAPLRYLSSSLREATEEETLWALRDVSFEVARGECLGIIGPNGAGKSTLLKILSRITEPTEGCARIRGRVGSLLEVGTGFHPELTGRENIYLNGAILGMTKAEIDRRFDEIVAFAEVEKFIDTPVKRYSSGMYVRLAFAVAAHLEPEILLVDEVLAVGDAAFQKKCLGKMGDVAHEGRTVLFVSHNLATIIKLCGDTLWLDKGKLAMMARAELVVSGYFSAGTSRTGERRWEMPCDAPGNEKIRVRAARVLNMAGEATTVIDVRHPFCVDIEYEILQSVQGLQIGFWLLTSDGVTVFVAGDNEDRAWTDRLRKPGRYSSRCSVPGRLLNSGTYTITLASNQGNGGLLFLEEGALRFDIEATEVPLHSSSRPSGVVCPSLDWRITQLD
ncbi:MAG: ABC transporter ATP-binding protein [Planctomycetota bacterium]